jgi:hypothetical protein
MPGNAGALPPRPLLKFKMATRYLVFGDHTYLPLAYQIEPGL